MPTWKSILILVPVLGLAGCTAADLDTASVELDDRLVVLSDTVSTWTNLTGELTTTEVGLPLPLVPRVKPAGSTHEQPFDVPADALFAKFNLTWSERSSSMSNDLDLYILDSDGRVVAQGASNAENEVAKVRMTSRVAPPFTVRVVNFDNPPTTFNVAVEVIS